MMEGDNVEIEQECLNKDFCNIKKVDKNQFSHTYKLLIETYKDGIDKPDGDNQEEDTNEFVPQSIKEKLESDVEDDEPISRNLNYLQDSTSRVRDDSLDEEEEFEPLIRTVYQSDSEKPESRKRARKMIRRPSNLAKDTSNTILLESRASINKAKSDGVASEPLTTHSDSVKKSNPRRTRRTFKIRSKPKLLFSNKGANRSNSKNNRSMAIERPQNINRRLEKKEGDVVRRQPARRIMSVQSSKKRPLVLPEFLDRSRIEFLDNKTNTRKISESLSINQECFRPSNPLKPFRDLNEPAIPKFALKLVKSLRPDGQREKPQRQTRFNVMSQRNQSMRNSEEYSQLSDYLESKKRFDKSREVSSVSKANHSRSKILRNSSKMIENYELSASQMQINNQMRKLEPTLIKFLEFNDRHPDKNKTMKFISNSLKSKSPFFSGFSPNFISQMLYLASVRFYPKDHVIYYPDDICDICCIVIFGILKTRITSSAYTLSHGAAIGEEAILKPHRTNIHKGETKTASRCCLLEFSKDDFNEVKIFSESNRRKNDYILLVSQIKKQFQMKNKLDFS